MRLSLRRKPKGPRRPQPYRRGHARILLERVAGLLAEDRERAASLWFQPEELEAARGAASAEEHLTLCLVAKRACLSMLLREKIMGTLTELDFSVRIEEGPQGPDDCAGHIEPSPAARAVLDHQWIANLRLSFRRANEDFAAVVIGEKRELFVPWYGPLVHTLVPLRRGVVMANLRRVFGSVLPDEELRRVSQAYTLHFLRFFLELMRAPWIRKAHKPEVRIENLEAAVGAAQDGRGVFFLTGHFGNWEVASVNGLGLLPEYRDRVHVIRKRLHPAWLDRIVTRRMEAAGFRTIPRDDALESVVALVEGGAAVTFVYDQFARGNSGVRVDFLGQEAATLRSLAILAISSGIPVVPVGTWREADGSHVLRFSEPLSVIACEDAAEAIWRNVRQYNQAIERMLLGHPEQWIWMHRRWKL